jgi:hypothetical protein
MPANQPETIQQFHTRYSIELEVTGCSRGYLARLPRAEVADRQFLRSATGDGPTPEDALADLARRISGKRLIVDAGSGSRRTIEVPQLTVEQPESEAKSPTGQIDTSGIPAHERRVAACINFCHGMPTELLEDGHVMGLMITWEKDDTRDSFTPVAEACAKVVEKFYGVQVLDPSRVCSACGKPIFPGDAHFWGRDGGQWHPACYHSLEEEARKWIRGMWMNTPDPFKAPPAITKQTEPAAEVEKRFGFAPGKLSEIAQADEPPDGTAPPEYDQISPMLFKRKNW